PGPSATPAAARTGGLDEVDRARIRSMCEALRSSSLHRLLGEVFSGVDGAPTLIESITRHCALDHGALLVFPNEFEDAIAAFAEMGAEAGPVVPSVIVKARLADRYNIPAEQLDVRLTHAVLTGTPDGARRTVEVFMLRTSADLPAGMIERERGMELERHVALRLVAPDPIVIQGLRWVLREHAGFHWDGGGYNPHDNAAAGGTSALYFLGWTQDPAGGAPRRQRIEVKFHGDFSYITATHVELPSSATAGRVGAVPSPRTGEITLPRQQPHGTSPVPAAQASTGAAATAAAAGRPASRDLVAGKDTAAGYAVPEMASGYASYYLGYAGPEFPVDDEDDDAPAGAPARRGPWLAPMTRRPDGANRGRTVPATGTGQRLRAQARRRAADLRAAVPPDLAELAPRLRSEVSQWLRPAPRSRGR
ncbi:MAG: hypothetical protein IRZ08_19875, partial [Frankia sp.]|nr:hypothetical protein [Frankia sp.]